MKDLKPYAKQLNQFFDRILGKEKIEVSTQNILLMSIVGEKKLLQCDELIQYY